MDLRAEYLTQILEKIGSPLMAAIVAARRPEETGADSEQDAQIMAGLLAKTVQVSIDLASAAELAKAGIQDDSLRVALAALAGPMVAAQYRQDAKIPDDTTLKKITGAMQAVLTFSENFAPSEDNTARLKNLAADAHQVNIQYIHAFIPVVNAIATFSFGQSEQKLIMEVSSKLVAKAATLNGNILGALPEEDQKVTDLATLRALAEIYAQCHMDATTRLQSMNEEERAAQPQATGSAITIDTVWSAFDLRVAMLEAMAKNTLPTGGASSGPAPNITSAPGSEPPAPPAPPQETPPPETSPLPEMPTEPPPAAAPAQETPPPPPPITETPAKPPGEANPMSMFAKPKAQNTTPPTQEAPPQESPAPPPPPEAPQESSPPPADPPAQLPENNENDKGTTEGSPMSFFKTPPKKDDES